MKKIFSLFVFAAVVLLSNSSALVAKYIVDPYATVDWTAAQAFKANFHTHGTVPDGGFTDVNDVINFYNNSTYAYKFLAITDHNAPTTWTASGTIKFSFYGCEAGQTIVTPPAVAKQDHIGSLFCTYAGSETDNMATRIAAIRSAGGLAVAHHPIRATTAGDATEAEYAALFKDPVNDHLVGLEVYSFHYGTHNSEQIWDNLVTDMLDEDPPLKNIWGFANDDMHSKGVTRGSGWNVIPLPESNATEAKLRQALVNGAFYFSTGAAANATVPVIDKITVNVANSTIAITLKSGSGTSTIKWYRDNGAVVKNTSGIDITSFTIDCDEIQNPSAAHYVRAVITNGTDKTFTQPFALRDNIEINSIQDLYKIRNIPDAQYVLAKNLDFEGDVADNYNDPLPSPWTDVNVFKSDMTSGAGWVPIASFTGELDGKSYKISNLFINAPTMDYTGLFANNGGKISNLGLTIKLVTGKDYTGGMTGGNVGQISNCFAVQSTSTSKIIGKDYVGGICGFNNSRIQSSYADIEVNGEEAAPFWDGAAGGFVGWNYGVIENCFARGKVVATSVAGGFSGFCMGIITNCYSTGQVSPVYGAGGFVGCGCGGWTSCYWDVTTSGLSYSTEGIGKTTAEMQTQATFTGWNFSGLWRMEGTEYPFLGWQKFDGGTGGADDPYKLKTVSALYDANRYVKQNPNENVHFGLEDDIDLTENIALGEPWVPVGTQTQKFQGHLNGHGYMITGLKVDKQWDNYVGLFGYVGNNAVVENLHVEIAGTDCVRGNVFVGGIAGWNDGTIRNCWVTGTGSVVATANSIGGLVGRVGYGGNVLNSYSTVQAKGDQFVGGLVGAGEYGSQVTNSYSKGLVSKMNPWSSGLGGLIGTNWGMTVASSYWDKQTSGQTTSAGGVGKLTSQMKQQATFLGWDFSYIWDIVANTTYPFLR